ncbi:AMP-dependent synthetase/ligase [Reinekea blandensis]|uniref:AMP-dependent synthetase and ligase n=1 Tax=Reinekea blandensis MED297 TaxID=314283 RepID=A4BB22_9GAMM|nr:AMP-binding protein [Reinekea blandensis]EAR10635.1 AMP-dependent synthetase and ligase [Reinekea sp. MED297] [Reinekea blandensis MED297]
MESYYSLTQMLQMNAQAYPDDIALRQKKHGIWQQQTWQDFLNVTQAIAAGLIELGGDRGSHIGIIAENCEEWVLAQLGVNFMGGVVCGVYPTSPSNEVVYLLKSADCTMVFCEDQEQVDKVLAIEDQLPLLKHIIVFDPKGLNNYDHDKLITLASLQESGAQRLQTERDCVNERHDQQQPDDTALIVFTSGSTGPPKAAMISYRNMWHEMLVIRDAIETEPGLNLLSYLPLCHIAEQAMSTLNLMINRVTINFGESLRTIRTDLQEISPDVFFGVPRIWEKMQAEISVLASRSGKLRGWLILRAMDKARDLGEVLPVNWSVSQKLSYAFWNAVVYQHLRAYLGLARCRFAMTAAAPISPSLLSQMRGMGIRICEIFGMTETTGAATIQPWHMNSEGRVGQPCTGVDCKVAEDGELLVKGGIIFKGYYKNEEATAETIEDGWLHTGDIAKAHTDGSFSIVDRKKDIMINAAGKNLSPSLIENTVKASAFIKECIVIADQRPYVTALLQIDPDSVPTWAEQHNVSYTTFKSLTQLPEVRELIAEEVEKANTQLARVEQIKTFYLLPKELDHDDGEVTATMKVRRKNIAEQYQREIEGLYGSA